MKMKLWLAASVAAVLLAAGAAVAAEAPKKPTVMKAKNGDVVFNHATHTMKCDACHPAVPMSNEPVGKDPAHKLCIDCHKAEAKGPVKCGECHKKG